MFRGEILARNSKNLGSWTAYRCDNRDALFERIRLGKDGANREYLLDRIPDFESKWPIAFLMDIRIDGHARRKGLGSKALSKFREEAIAMGCNGALARVGFDHWERRDKNISFYEKNGWVLLTKEEDMPCPLDLVFLEL